MPPDCTDKISLLPTLPPLEGIKLCFNWPTLVFQGLPALTLAVPEGLVTYFFGTAPPWHGVFGTHNPHAPALAGAWFGAPALLFAIPPRWYALMGMPEDFCRHLFQLYVSFPFTTLAGFWLGSLLTYSFVEKIFPTSPSKRPSQDVMFIRS